MINLKKEINLNKKFVVILILVNVMMIFLYYSYALFQITVIQDNVVVIKTGTVNIVASIEGLDNPSFTLASGEVKTVTVNLNTTNEGDIAYKLYYVKTGGVSDFVVTSSESFTDNIVEGIMTTSKTIVLTFENTGSEELTIYLGAQAGLVGYDIELKQGTELIIS